MEQIFTPDTPPRSGNALRLWRWWSEMNNEPPDELAVLRPGRHQRAAGCASYIINGRFIVYAAEEALKQTMADAQPDRMTGDYYFD